MPTSSASVLRRLSAWIGDELDPRNFGSSCGAAIVLFLLDLILLLSLLSLVFNGRLTVYVPAVLGWLLLANALMIATVALLSSYGGSIAGAQDSPAVIVAVATTTLAANPAIGQAQLFASVLLLICVSTLALGAVYLLVGALKLGGLVRFVPYPVVAGFLAGTGWLLCAGGIGVAAQVPLATALLRPDALARWLPALLLGVCMSLAVRRWRGVFTVPLVIALGGVLFWGVMLLRGAPFAAVAAEGWLLGPFPRDAGLGLPPVLAELRQASWPDVVSVAPLAAPALLLGLLGLLLNASSLELIVKRDVNLNRELRAAGVANVLSGLAGGMLGYHRLSLTTLSHALGRGKRLPGLLVAVLLVLVATGGTALLSFFPRLLLGGMLIFIGLQLLYQYVVAAWFSFSRSDYFVIITILVVVAGYGFLWGVGVGLVMAIVLFLLNYSRIDSVRQEQTGATFRSRVSRGAQQMELLQAHGDALLIYRLRGYIFFGTANNLIERITERVRGSPLPLRCIVLDFADVSGLDATAVLSFSKLLHATGERKIELLLSGLSVRAREQLRRGGLVEQPPALRMPADLDRAVEAGEERLLADAQSGATAPPTPNAPLPGYQVERSALLTVTQTMRRRELLPGEVLIRQGDEPDRLYFIESGQLTARLEQPGREPVRLETMQDGRMVGEVGFLLGTRRSASVVADCPTVVYSVSRAEWDELRRQQPELDHTLSLLVLQLLAQRVAHLTRVVDVLQ